MSLWKPDIRDAIDSYAGTHPFGCRKDSIEDPLNLPTLVSTIPAINLLSQCPPATQPITTGVTRQPSKHHVPCQKTATQNSQRSFQTSRRDGYTIILSR